MTKRGLKIATIGLCNCSINMISDMAEKFDCPAEDVFCDFGGGRDGKHSRHSL
ncbi:MAG: hypothetical protein OSJ72_07555 [Lachnospiraceae bacterium]|nr:hypothetical protein [Lachnospiraceae bacterium]